MSILLSITSSYNLVSILIMCALCSSERLITSHNFLSEPVSVLRPGYLGLSELLVIGLDCHVAVAAPRLGLRLEPGQNLHNIEIEVVCNATKCLILPEFFRVGLVQTQLTQILFPF